MNKIIQFLLISVLGINVATAANLVTMREGGGQKYQIDKDSIEKKGQYDQVKIVVDYKSNQKMKNPNIYTGFDSLKYKKDAIKRMIYALFGE